MTVTAFHTPRWIKVCLRSYRDHFPDHPIAVVNNNPAKHEPPDGTNDKSCDWSAACDVETRWLERFPRITLLRNPGPNREHGACLDLLLQFSRQAGYDYMLCLDPDCLVRGRAWLERLMQAAEAGDWMTGGSYCAAGPLHNVPAIFDTRVDWHSFRAATRGEDLRHPRYQEVVDLERLRRFSETFCDGAAVLNWDTGQRNWFLAATADKARFVDCSDGLIHFWGGSWCQRQCAFLDSQEAAKYLAEP